MTMSLRTLTLISVMALGLTGCVSLSTPDLEQSWQGRFSISAESATNRENHSGRFTLTHTSDVLTILDLKSPLGNTLARITQTPKNISLETLGNPTIEASDAESLLLETLGFSVPVEGPPYRQIEQNGWLIQYENYDESALPKRIRLQRPNTENSPSISILLLISNRNAS